MELEEALIMSYTEIILKEKVVGLRDTKVEIRKNDREQLFS